LRAVAGFASNINAKIRSLAIFMTGSFFYVSGLLCPTFSIGHALWKVLKEEQAELAAE
jgi:hypothetical protein